MTQCQPRSVLRLIAVLRVVLLGGLASLWISPLQADDTFVIGQPAPAFKSGRWLKGEPVTELERGRIYVLEFWATWCGPCLSAMPHLSELARQHRDHVTVIGVNVMERGPAERVEPLLDKFVAQMGDKLDYANCRDTADDYLLNHWYNPSKSLGIPASIVVDAQGRIAWVGHPHGLPAVLDALIANTFEYENAAAKFTATAAKNDALNKVLNAYIAATEAGDWAGAIAVVDNHPEYSAMLSISRFTALLHVDADAALTQVKEAIAKQDRRTFGHYLLRIAMADGLAREVYQFAADQYATNHQPTDYRYMAKLAHRLGESGRAVDYQLRYKEHIFNQEDKAPPAVLEKVDEDLALYRRG